MIAVLALACTLLFQYARSIPVREIYPVGDANEDSISNVQLLLPIMAKRHGSQDKRDIHYPNIHVQDFDHDLHIHTPSDYISNNDGFMYDSSEHKPLFIRNDNQNFRSVKKELNENNVNDLLKDVTLAKPKVPLDLLKVCDRLLNHPGLKPNNIQIEIAVHYCKELLDALTDKDETDKNESYDEDSKEYNLPDVKSKYYSIEDDSSGDCPCCPQYILTDLNHFDHDNHLHNFDKRGSIHVINPEVRDDWFGPYNGRRNWMVLNEPYPGMLRNYINKVKKTKLIF